MAERSNIEWTDATFNPWIGCTKVSPACDHCYAERDFDLRRHVVQWGAGQARKRTSTENWKFPKRWNDQPFRECQDCGWRGEEREAAVVSRFFPPISTRAACPSCSSRLINPARRRVFCASLADVFDNEVPAEWLVDLLELIRLTPELDWLLLSKRIGNWRKRLEEARGWTVESQPPHPWNLHILEWLDGKPPANVWLGATICNQAEADRDIPKLLATPAAVRFISVEPMLGPISFEGMFANPSHVNDGTNALECLDWVICGGESGPRARPMHPQWARDLRDQCAVAGVPFLFKQWGEWGTIPGHGAHYPAGIAPDGSWVGAEDQFTEDCALMYRVGKKAAGRLLDGVEHNGFPEVRR